MILFLAVAPFFTSFTLSKKLGGGFCTNTVISFTATGKDFELAITIAIGIFSINSGHAFAGVVGPLEGVPALVLMVNKDVL